MSDSQKPKLEERPGVSVARPGVLLAFLIVTVISAGYAIYRLIRAARG
ncbi:MAG: hypothetical protein QM756_46435 [Polyangiaceae bacterium]